jgi:hypothetical protein
MVAMPIFYAQIVQNTEKIRVVPYYSREVYTKVEVNSWVKALVGTPTLV